MLASLEICLLVSLLASITLLRRLSSFATTRNVVVFIINPSFSI
nr:MAG TPA: hypothetical protein [Caudoviricetes sp.]